MAIERTKFLYEILIRFGPDGYQGAHRIDLERVADGDEVISDKELPAEPITEAEAGEIIGAQSAKLIEAADTARGLAVASTQREADALARAEAAETRATAAEKVAEEAAATAADAAAKFDRLMAAIEQATAA